MADPRYRYTLTFEAGALVPDRVRQLLEITFGAHDVSVETELVRRIPKHLRLTPAESKVVELLGDLKAHRLKEITVVAQLSQRTAALRVLQGLIDVEVVKKVRHGVYALADAPGDLDVPVANNDVPRTSEARVLEWLSTPTLATEIRERLGVTRQRVDQILKGLEQRGRIVRHRTAGEAAGYLYVRTDVKCGPALAKRPPRLTTTKARLLSALRPDRLVRLYPDATEHLDTHAHVVKANAQQLERHGLVSLFKLGAHTYVILTPLGLDHPQYHPLEEREAPAADVYATFGRVRAAFLQVLDVLGPLRTLELTYAVPEALLEGEARGSGQFVAALEREGLVEPRSDGQGHAKYALTDRGALAARLISIAHPSPSASDLKALIEARWALRRQRQSASLARRTAFAGALSPCQASALKALEQHGTLSTPEVFRRMDQPPSNPGSMHLMLTALAKRGAVQRLEATGASRSPVFWRVAQPAQRVQGGH